MFKTIEIDSGKTVNPVHSMYLDYLNNFLTITAFAEHYSISVDTAVMILTDGKNIHDLETSNY